MKKNKYKTSFLGKTYLILPKITPNFNFFKHIQGLNT